MYVARARELLFLDDPIGNYTDIVKAAHCEMRLSTLAYMYAGVAAAVSRWIIRVLCVTSTLHVYHSGPR